MEKAQKKWHGGQKRQINIFSATKEKQATHYEECEELLLWVAKILRRIRNFIAYYVGNAAVTSARN